MELEKNKKEEERENEKFHLSYATWVLLILIVSLCIVFTFSFAFQKPKKLEPGSKVEIGMLEVSMNDGGNGVVVNEMLPVLDEDAGMVPVYQFTVKNPTEEKVSYQLFLQELELDEIKDGCTSEDLLDRSQLRYQLIMNDKAYSFEDLSELKNSELGRFEISSSEVQTFSLRIFVPESKKATDWANKHYHYKVIIKNEEVS